MENKCNILETAYDRLLYSLCKQVPFSILNKSPDYIRYLMQIANDHKIDITIRKRAVKGLIEECKKWPANNKITADDKNHIKTHLIDSIVNCPNDKEFIKLYRQSLSTVIQHQYRNWNILAQILDMTQNQQTIYSGLVCLLAYITVFQFSIVDQERNNLYTTARQCLPILHQIYTQTNNRKIKYCCIKIIWKIIHYQLSFQCYPIIERWTPILIEIVAEKNTNIVPTQQQKYDTQQFLYFHTKKWAVRIINRLFQKHFRCNNSFVRLNQQKKQFITNWQQKYYDKLIRALIAQIQLQNIPRKIKYFIIKSLYQATLQSSILISQFKHLLLFDILPEEIKLKQQQKHLIKTHAAQFLLQEQSMSFINTRKAALDAWYQLAKLPAECLENIQFLHKLLSSKNTDQASVALRIFTVLQRQLLKNPEIQKAMINIVGDLATSLPHYQDEFFKIELYNFLSVYSQKYTNKQNKIIIIQVALSNLSTATNFLIQIKILEVIKMLSKNKFILEIVLRQIDTVLDVFLILVSKIKNSTVFAIMETIICNIVSHQCQHTSFRLFYQKLWSDNHIMFEQLKKLNNESEDGELQLCLSSSIKILTQLINVLDAQDLQAIEQNILNVCQIYFTTQYAFEQIPGLIKAYMKRISSNNLKFFFLFKGIIYCHIVGGVANLRTIQIPYAGSSKKVSVSVRRQEISEADASLFKNILLFYTHLIVSQNQYQKEFRNVVHQILSEQQLINIRNDYIYSFKGCVLLHCIQLMPPNFFLQNNDLIYENTMRLNQSRHCPRSLSIQIVLILFWKYRQAFVQIMENDNRYNLQFLVNRIVLFHQFANSKKNRRRLILGLSSYLTMDKKLPTFRRHHTQMFRILLMKTKEQCKERQEEAKNKEIKNIKPEQNIQPQQDNFPNNSQEQMMPEDCCNYKKQECNSNQSMQQESNSDNDNNYNDEDENDDYFQDEEDADVNSITQKIDEIQYFITQMTIFSEKYPQNYRESVENFGQRRVRKLLKLAKSVLL